MLLLLLLLLYYYYYPIQYREKKCGWIDNQNPCHGGGVGGFLVSLQPIFGFLFRFSYLKTAVFRFWCLVRFAGFPRFSLWIRFLSTMMAVFRIFLSHAFYGFCGFAKEAVTPSSRAKAVRSRDHLYSILTFLLEEWMTSLVWPNCRPVSSVGRAWAPDVQTSAGPTLRVFKKLRRKCCLCNDICKW